ncbi:unnamed protein product [Acanthoscelides obtectus]|uniref:Uncharacterized protein n=1 Tax=Acanthoscelides obtectus TaxID=200917 RepID=A0A9P0PQT6_ACAOB|nr:unnamed protein product [Acanthoscelides obtectus]CAK1656848.1 hypothetical protein AOBTE_LOCUS19959 [Acanthoscelides obtectus]
MTLQQTKIKLSLFVAISCDESTDIVNCA